MDPCIERCNWCQDNCAGDQVRIEDICPVCDIKSNLWAGLKTINGNRKVLFTVMMFT